MQTSYPDPASSESELSRIHHVARIERGLDSAQHVESGAVLRRHERRQLESHAVMVVDDGAGTERGGDAVLPYPVVQGDRVRAAIRQNESGVDHRAPGMT